MLKSEEIRDPRSCLNRATDNEPIFVLLARDQAAADTVRWWAAKRLEMGLNRPDDPQIREAFDLADRMERERPTIYDIYQQAQKVRPRESNVPTERLLPSPDPAVNPTDELRIDPGSTTVKVLCPQCKERPIDPKWGRCIPCFTSNA